MIKYTDYQGKVIHVHDGVKVMTPYPKGTCAVFIDMEEVDDAPVTKPRRKTK